MSGAPRSTAAAERADRATEGGSSFRTSREGGGKSGLQGPKPIIWSGLGFFRVLRTQLSSLRGGSPRLHSLILRVI